MILFVTVLKALAAIIITNAHYVGVYPTDLIANGGLLGDVLFFAVSGFCLCNIKLPFFRWYGKRIVRIYPQVLLITALYLLIGVFSLGSGGVFRLFVYPTNYHFVASIVFLYIPFYAIMRIEKLKAHLPAVMLAVFAAALLVYILFIDKTTYNVDTVRAPFIRFLFAESMLLGAYFRTHLSAYQNKSRAINWILTVLFAGTYFASKMAFSKIPSIGRFQIVNQIVLFLLLYFIFKSFAGIDGKLERMPAPVKSVFSFLSRITLEIYLVQIGIIPFFAALCPFPLNWLCLTGIILCGAFLLHFVCTRLVELCRKGIGRMGGA